MGDLNYKTIDSTGLCCHGYSSENLVIKFTSKICLQEHSDYTISTYVHESKCSTDFDLETVYYALEVGCPLAGTGQ